MTVDEAIETLRYEIDEECHCEYIADEIRLLIETVENLCFQLRELQLKGGADNMGRYDHYTDTFVKERGGEK